MEHRIPQVLAEYFDKCGQDWAIDEILDFEYLEEEDEDDVSRWLYDSGTAENNRRYALACLAYVEGYEAEPEPLYYVKFPGKPGIDHYLHISFKGYFDYYTEKDCPGGICRFTEEKIKSIDERYWAFAVPVEEENK